MTTRGDQRIAAVLKLKAMLTEYATGGELESTCYQTMRAELIHASWAKGLVPDFLRKCRVINDFWSFIKGKFDHYQERREYLRDEFDPLLTKLEQETALPVDKPVARILTEVDSAHVHEAWAKALDRRESDPDGAMTAARSLVETVCKHILDDLDAPYNNNEQLPKLYGKVAQSLNLAPSQHEEQVFKKILGGCQTVVDNLCALRNRLSDAHGKGSKAIKPSPRHASLAVNLAGTMACFLVESWEARGKK